MCNGKKYFLSSIILIRVTNALSNVLLHFFNDQVGEIFGKTSVQRMIGGTSNPKVRRCEEAYTPNEIFQTDQV